MKPLKLFFVFSFVSLLVSSCVTPREVNYLQNLKHNQTIPLSENFEAQISPNDQLRITVIGVGDEKELAEHNMLVDLGRNDLGRISKFGTVEVEKLHQIESRNSRAWASSPTS